MNAYWMIRLYFRFLGTHLRGSLENPSDFWIMLFSVILTQGSIIVFLKAIFAQVPTLNGWSFWQVVIMFGLVTLGEGVCNLFFEGMWWLATRINRGELDYFLVRPYPIILQVSSSVIGLNGVGNATCGLALVVVGVLRADFDASPIVWATGLALLLSSLTIRISVNIASNAMSFWIAGPAPVFAGAIHQGAELVRYPLTLYPYAIRVLLILVVPFAFISFYPVMFMAGGPLSWVGLLTPLAGIYGIFTAKILFSRGLRRYESAGN